MSQWRNPILSLHGIEGAFYEPGEKTIIPGTVIGKFSLRIVPDMTPEEVEKKVIAYLEKQWKARESPNKIKVSMCYAGRPWSAIPDHPVRSTKGPSAKSKSNKVVRRHAVSRVE